MFNLEFQRQVVHLLATNVQFAVNNGHAIRSEHFDTVSLRTIFDIVYDFSLKYENEMDLSAVMIQLDELIRHKAWGTEISTQLYDEAKEVFKTKIKSEDYIKDKVLKFARRQALRAGMIKIIDILEEDGDDTRQEDRIVNIIDEAFAVGCELDLGLSLTDMIKLPQFHREAYSADMLVRTGIASYDYALKGGMAPGELHVIEGPPKSGKSTIACNIGANAMVFGKNVFHVTAELQQIDILTKYAQRITKSTVEDITCKEIFESRLERFNMTGKNLFVKYFPEGTASALDVRAWISKIRSSKQIKPHLIILDYDDLFVPSKHADDMYQGAGAFYRDVIVNLAGYFHCPVLTLAQPKRDAWSAPDTGLMITAADLAHSSMKAHKCHSISSINFKRGSNTGILYADMVRRGFSDSMIHIKKDLNISLFHEDYGNAQNPD